MTGVRPGDRLADPPADVLDATRIGAFVRWLAEHRGLAFDDPQQLWRWSVADLDGFWSAVWEFFEVADGASPQPVLADRSMPGAVWFPTARLNYAARAVRGPDARPGARPGVADLPSDGLAVLGRSQSRDDVDLTWEELRDQVARARRVLSDLGVGPGDRVAAYLPNVPEAVVAFLATAGLGAVWCSCALEFGVRSVVERIEQVAPRVLLVAGGYRWGATDVDRSQEVAAVVAAVDSIESVLDIRYGPWQVPDARSWPDLLAEVTEPMPQTSEVPFDHPLAILFSSGTTGRPKAIVHGHGGVLLEHLKNHALSWDVGAGDRMLWYTTTAWMMWNAQVSALLLGASIVTVDGHPAWPDLGWQWRLAEQTGATVMGASPGFVTACRDAGVDPRELQLAVRVVGSAGSPLPPEGYRWLYDHLGEELLLNVGSGGTDVCTGLVQNNPWLPVHAGQIAGPCLGVAATAYDERGEEVVGALGELVVTAPMPSMPIGFWGDEDGSRLRATYFDRFPGVWRHGDWVQFEADGRCHVAGRSDATLNRGGVRLGTAEFYAVVEEVDGVADSLVVHLEDPHGGNGQLIMLVVAAAGHRVDDDLVARVRSTLRRELSPRHVPDRVVAVPAVPRNLTGKKLEVPVKRILQGHDPRQVAQRDALADPGSLDAVIALAADVADRATGSATTAGAGA